MKDLSIYVHIPFCESKCYYCDFISYTDKSQEDIEDYIDALIVELSLYKSKLRDYNVTTIFIGGGTPSSIDSKYIARILNYIYDNYNIKKLEEISIEINPGSISEDKAREYLKSGVNRCSLGLQSTNNEMLKAIGRKHSYEDFLGSYEILRSLGFDNINIDMIFGLPEQNLDDIYWELDKVIKLLPEHISYYSLILEKDTIMHNWYEEGRYNFPDTDLDRRMYHDMTDILKSRGYNHYEISNFSKHNRECKHNLRYWKIEPYLGVGLNSHSNLFNVRFENTKNFNRYIRRLSERKFPIVAGENINREMEIAEYCIMGIRLIDGINKAEFQDRFKLGIYQIYGDVIRKHVVGGLLKDNGRSIKLTRKGLDLSNQVELDFFPNL